MPTIRIDDDVWKELQSRAQPFVDTPNDVIKRVLGLSHTNGRKEPGESARRGPSNSEVTSDKDYYIPILQAVIDLGGRATARDVVDRVGVTMKDRLKPADYELLKRGELRWRTSAHFARNDMVNVKRPPLLSPESPRGWWEVTEAGRQFLAQQSPRTSIR